jgi:hypothetical protein
MGQQFLVGEPACILADWSSRLWKTRIACTITKHFGKGGIADPTFSARENLKKHGKGRVSFPIAYQLSRQCNLYAVALHNAETFDTIYYDVPTQLRDLLVGPW